MGGKKSVNEKLKFFKKKLSKKFKLTKMIFFGSRAKGKTGKNRDIDLIIVSPDFEQIGFFQRGANMYDFWDLNYAVDFLCFTPQEFNKLKNKITIVREAIKEGIEI